jgi:pyruvate dehydrogenase E2 component (dihydrolipoamide acetyltransferase)
MTDVIMPKMGDGMEEGTLLQWLKKDGDSVKSGEVIGNIQTDKAILELEAPGTGKLAGIIVAEGQTVPVGTRMAAVLKEGESLPPDWQSGSAAAPAAVASEEPAKLEPTPEKAAAVASGSNGSGRVKASPLARRIAEEKGLDLGSISGSGPGGRIVERDVRTAAPSAPARSTAPAVATLTATAEDQKVPLNKIRQLTAKRTAESKQQVPHFYVTVEVDLEKIGELRAMFESDESGKISINDFIIKATALALREMPVVNSSYQGDHVLQHGGVHVGMAVALEDGLTLPVIKHADQLSLRQIAARAKELGAKARDNQLSLDELSGNTFSISNMGMLDVENFAAIIVQPNAGIIAVSSAKKTVVATADDEIEIRLRMKMTGSFDHRVVDGAVGAKFMNLVREYLENPTRLLS